MQPPPPPSRLLFQLFSCFSVICWLFFQNQLFEIFCQNIFRVSNCLDPAQASGLIWFWSLPTTVVGQMLMPVMRWVFTALSSIKDYLFAFFSQLIINILIAGFAQAWKIDCLEKSLKFKFALKSTWKNSKALKSPWILPFTGGFKRCLWRPK